MVVPGVRRIVVIFLREAAEQMKKARRKIRRGEKLILWNFFPELGGGDGQATRRHSECLTEISGNESTAQMRSRKQHLQH